MSTLLLLTHQYPMRAGDGHFVKNELPTLAQYYKRVIVCPLQSRPDTEHWPLPANTTVLPGPKLNTPAAILWRGLLNRASWRTVWQLWRQDRAAIRKPVHLKNFILACLQGRALAAAVYPHLQADPDTDIYAFWGAGAAYALPWLAHLPHPHYMRLHGFDLYETRQQGYIPFRQPVFARARALIAISAHGQRHLQQRLQACRLDPHKAVLNKLGTLPPPAVPRAPAADGTLILVSCSSVIALKRVALIYAVVADFARRHAADQTLHWHHFGDGPLLPELRAACQDAPPNLQVHLAGQCDNKAIVDFYTRHPVAALLNLSSSEGIPVSIMEALSCGIPVLATDVGGTAEIVGSALGSGRLVDADSSVHDMADALTDLLADARTLRPAAFWQTHHHAVNNAHQLAGHILHRPLHRLPET
ncbi:glycosyltransferase involved in cell wall biosynthesis [Neisseria sp. HSC-16F19]|nr:glycosyltransferase [Neisseria sp. HSC-16F19]MCP2041242.1 glycosyltransferase involved in cell wall biosynthesis [Neisseria sp. HSC-16F19]